MEKQVKTHIIEQRESDGMCFPVTKIYVVRQWQPDENYMGTAVCAFTNYDDAVKEMKRLNKEYSYGVKWYKGEKYENCDVDEDDYDYHYYDVDSLTLNKGN